MPSKAHDSYHDYRPDPQFDAVSHLATKDAAQDGAAIPESAKSALGLLDGFQEWFVWGDDTGSKTYASKLWEEKEKRRAEAAYNIKSAAAVSSADGEGAPLPLQKEPERPWAELPLADKRRFVNNLNWKEACSLLLEKESELPGTYNFCDKDGKSAKKDPTVNGKFKTGGGEYYGFAPYFPYCERLLRLAGSWAEVKRRFIEDPLEQAAKKAKAPQGGEHAAAEDHGGHAEGALPPEETIELTRDQGAKLMVALLNFRATWAWDAINWLKEGGKDKDRKKVKILAKAVGSADTTSDIDITISGDEDVAAVVEINRYHRRVYNTESLFLTDTMFYIRDWMTVADSINRDNKEYSPKTDDANLAKLVPNDENYAAYDTCLQVQVLDFLGDIGGLMKIRRYASADQWRVFSAAILDGIEVDGLTADQIPMFGRVKQVDHLYRTWYYEPLSARSAYIDENLELAGHHAKAFRSAYDMSDPLFHLELLAKIDRNSFIREMNFAYNELMAKVREDGRALREDPKFKGDFVWFQNYGKALVGVQSGLNLAGMQAYTERQSLLVSEAIPYAAEAYNCQGSLWSVVGGQGGARPANLGLPHFLQTFNEQIGDALKELWEYVYEAWEHSLGSDELVLKEAEGFYRASKYEGRMAEVLQSILDMLRGNEKKKDKDGKSTPIAQLPEVKARIDAWKKLFPGELSPDEMDLGDLSFEASVGALFDKHVGELVSIRKLRGDYANTSKSENQQTAFELVRDALSKDPLASMRNDRLRQVLKFPGDSIYAVPPILAAEKNPLASEKTKSTTVTKLGAVREGPVINLMNLMHHLLTHAVIVNRVVRKVMSRGPVDVYVRSWAD